MAPRKAKQPKTAAQRRLEADHLITRLTRTDCKRCGRPLHVGTVWGEPTRIDRTHLNLQGELAGLLLGCKTFEEQKPGGRIHRRSPAHILAGLPRHGYILAEHQCGMRWQAQHYDLRQIFPTHGEDAPCPF